jgi:hypothetical protein
LTATANTAVAPDGTTTMDTLAATGASGNVAQAFTITAGNAMTLSVYAKQLASQWLILALTDGTDTVSAWFNVAAGTAGSNTAGAGQILYSAKSIDPVGNGIYRCKLTVTTTVATSFTASFAPAAADSTASANTNSAYAWGAQVDSPGSTSAVSSYIPTTSATVTRSGDVLNYPISTSWFNSSEGTLFIEWTNKDSLLLLSTVFGGIGDTFSDTIYLSRSGTTAINMTVASGGVGQVAMGKTITFTEGAIMRAAMAWAVNDYAFVVDGGSVSTDTSGALPTSTLRLGIGSAPYSAAASANANTPIRRFAYYPRRLANTVLQSLTAA